MASMKVLRLSLILLGCAASVWLLDAQAPAGGATKGGPTPAVDFSGYWTGNMQEDGAERGAGPELVDYGGISINAAGRAGPLSYDTSRLTSRFHHCDGYVAPYSVRAIANTLVWEERDTRRRTLIAIH